MQGRIEGRASEDGQTYEVRQGAKVLKSIPIHDAMNDRKLAKAIGRNKWQGV